MALAQIEAFTCKETKKPKTKKKWGKNKIRRKFANEKKMLKNDFE